MINWKLGNILRDIESGHLKKRYEGSFKKPYRDDPAPRRDLLPREQFLTTSSLIATRGCHNRCYFCYLSTKDMHMPCQLRDVEQVVKEFVDNDSPYAVLTDNNLRSRPDGFAAAFASALRLLQLRINAAR